MPPGLAHLFALTGSAATVLMKQGFSTTVMDRLADGTDAAGRRLPASAHVAAVRLGLKPAYRKGVYAPSRVDRMIQADTLSILRSLTARDTALQRLTNTGTLSVSRPAVRTGLAQKLVRQVAKYLTVHPAASSVPCASQHSKAPRRSGTD